MVSPLSLDVQGQVGELGRPAEAGRMGDLGAQRGLGRRRLGPGGDPQLGRRQETAILEAGPQAVDDHGDPLAGAGRLGDIVLVRA
jgi:hypothetical protein